MAIRNLKRGMERFNPLNVRFKSLRGALAASLPLLFAGSVDGQNLFTIADGSGAGCQGVIFDSGGQGAAGYSNDENYTFTICPDVPGNVIYLTFTNFDLDQSGPQNSWDQLSIFDGDNTSALPLGDYTGNSLQNIIISGTVFNTSGCLTLVFQSNSVGTGVFAASFQCTIPCQNPTASAVMSETVPALVCQGESVNFNGSASTAQPGYTIQQYLWNFDDGSVDSTSGPIVDHVFTDDGEHVVQLYVTDDNGCKNLNLVDLQVLVSTTPNFGFTSESQSTCFGETVTMVGNAQPVTWTGIPDANFGDGVFLPDDVGLPFTSSLTFEQFDPGQTVTSMSDIESICVEMEHTYMGDLVLQVICPNGQTVILHQQGGGGTYLGAPNDFDSNEAPIFGECWEYCWDPNATNGTWIENTGNTTQAGTPPNNSLNPGTYESVQPMTNLIGCPLNGEWTYQSTDLWGADNGFICSWSINFNPAIIPDVTQFTPVIGADADSSVWSGGVPPEYVSANGDTAIFTADAPGTYDFVYTVTDNFGCSYDTTISVVIEEPLFIQAGADAVICNDPVQLQATVLGAPTACDWVLQMDDSFGDGWNGSSLTVTIDGVASTYTVPFGDQNIVTIPVNSGDVIELTYAPGNYESEVSYILLDDAGNTVFTDGPNPFVGLAWTGTANCNGIPPMTYIWSPADGLSDPNISDPTADVTSETDFIITAYPVGHPACATTDTVTVSLDPGLDPGTDSSIVVCAYPPAFNLIDMLGGTPNAGGVWTDAGGAVVPATFDPGVDAAGTYTYTVTTVLGCIGTADLEIAILPADDPLCCGIVNAGPDSVICDLTYGLSASIGNTGTGAWSGPAGYQFADPTSPQTTVTGPSSGSAEFFWIEDDGAVCYLIDSVTITFTTPVEATATPVDAVCFEACDGIATVTPTGGNGAFTYDWSGNVAGANDATASELCAGVYTVEVKDENDCAFTVEYTIGQPVLLEIDTVTFVEPWCFGDANGSITIVDAEAIEYSFDDATTWSAADTKDSLAMGVYRLAIRNADGCVGTLDFQLPEPPEVIAEFDHIPQPANVDAPTVTFYNYSENSVAWLWDIAGLESSTLNNPVFTFDNRYAADYEVCLTAFDNHGCTDTVCNTIVVEDVLYTYAPNGFTPDGNGVNDLWWVTSNMDDIAFFDLQVFDRWGQVVFTSTDPLIAWDGTKLNGGGDILKQDVYAFRLTYQVVSTGAWREQLGHVSLLK